VNALDQAHREEGLSTLIVVSEDALGQAATADYCTQIRAQYFAGLTVVFDPELALERAYGANDLVMLTNERLEVVFTRRGAPLSAVETALLDELAR